MRLFHKFQAVMEESMGENKFENRFGQIAIEKGFVTGDQIRVALEVQAEEDAATGVHRPIGRILFSLGLLNLQQINEVLEAQKKLG
jgi:hypothetical protein